MKEKRFIISVPYTDENELREVLSGIDGISLDFDVESNLGAELVAEISFPLTCIDIIVTALSTIVTLRSISLTLKDGSGKTLKSNIMISKLKNFFDSRKLFM